MKSSLPLGAHMSIAGELHLAFARGEKAGCTAMQIFTKNANQWRGKPISAEAAEKFRKAWQASSIGPVAAHDTYLINLAAPEDDKWQKSIAAFCDEMERCALLGVPHLVMHPGAHLGEGEEAGLKRELEQLGFGIVAFACTTCNGMSMHTCYRHKRSVVQNCKQIC